MISYLIIVIVILLSMRLLTAYPLNLRGFSFLFFSFFPFNMWRILYTFLIEIMILLNDVTLFCYAMMHGHGNTNMDASRRCKVNRKIHRIHVSDTDTASQSEYSCFIAVMHPLPTQTPRCARCSLCWLF